MRNILLVEPNYKNKYPPLGLMKISSYHKKKGDNVIFVKGTSKEATNRIWDRIYITTLFTFHFNLTVKTIRYYKNCVNNITNIYVGGILASLMPDKLKEETGIVNVITGQIDNTIKIGFKDNGCIDTLIPDYDILKKINYKYPAGDNYFAYTTRGCPNKCKFCAVPLLEPQFKTTNNIYRQIKEINKKFGIKRNLLLLDNNILYSSELVEIIQDIKKAGFTKTPNYVDPLAYEILFPKFKKNEFLQEDIDNLFIFLNEFKSRIKSSNDLMTYENLIAEIDKSTDKGKAIVKHDDEFRTIHQKYRNKIPKQRYVDFNQGIDSSLLTDDKMKIISDIPINPLRIAFDSINEKNKYINAVRLAKKYGIKEVSNYLLYNYIDKPEDLWYRLKLSVELREELAINIFSFPMKYIPITNTDRNYIGKHWNKKFLRAIQAILLVKKGIVSTQKSFFEKAFGSSLDEFFKILFMPEDFIIYRFYYERKGLTEQWEKIYSEMSDAERQMLLKLIKDNKFTDIDASIGNIRIFNMMKFYNMRYEDIKSSEAKIRNVI